MAQRVSGAFARGLWGLGFSAGTCRTWPCACAPSNIPLQTAPCLRQHQSASQPLVPVWISLASCTAGSTGVSGAGATPAGTAPSAIADPGRRGHGRPGTSAGCTAGGCRRLPAGRRASPPAGAPGTAMPAAHGAHRTASLNLFSLPLFHPASPVFLCRSPVFFLHYITSAL